MESLEILLSDQYVTFTQKVAEKAAHKKELKAGFKQIYDDYQESIKILDKEVLQLQAEFEEWKTERNNQGDG